MAPTTAEVLDRDVPAGGDTSESARSMRWPREGGGLLGSSDALPQSLKPIAGLVLTSNIPLSVVWGSERVHLWNSEYPVGGERRSAWPERAFEPGDRLASPACCPSLDRCFQTGEAERLIDAPLFLERNGRPEEAFFSLFFSPIRDEAGKVIAVLHPAVETTQLVLAKRRNTLLRQIVERCAGAESIDKALSLAAEAMAEHPLDVPFAALYRVTPEGNTAELAGCTGGAVGHPACPPRVSYGPGSDAPWPFEKALRGTGPVLVGGIETKFAGWTCGPYSRPPRQALVHRVDIAGQPAALLVVGLSAARPLDEEYKAFHQMLVATVTGSMANACAAQARTGQPAAGPEVKRTEALLQQAKQEVEAFAHTLSHDVRAPIRHLDGFAQMLEETEAATLSPEGKRLLQRFRACAERMGGLIDDLVRLSLTGRGGVTRINVDNQAMVRAVWDEVASSKSGGVPAELELKSLPAFEADPVLLRMLWQNLIGNAVKFSALREPPRVTIDAFQESGRTWYRIADNGVGFDDQYAYKLFNAFQRLHRPDQFTGTGIGLAIAKKIVKLHGGDIRGHGTPDGGAVFEFTLGV